LSSSFRTFSHLNVVKNNNEFLNFLSSIFSMCEFVMINPRFRDLKG
jgi:hypothetical protein